MAAAKLLLGILCFTAFGRSGIPERDPVKRVMDVSRSQLGVRELTGKNDGIKIEAYLKYVGFKKGNPWCAAYVSWVFKQAGFSQPKTAWSPGLFPLGRIVKQPAAGLVFGIYFNDLKRIAHCGFVENTQGDFVLTIEGNTNVEGSREGQGVYRRLRHKRTINKYANWI
jgi:hypothetical protein